MALQSAYKQFLAAPNPTFLAENASIHYITTLVTYSSSAEILKHLTSQTRQLKKKAENFLDVVEAESSLAVVVETTIEFLTGGGAYLPGLDDNFLADRTVAFPTIHFVTFDGNGKIAQIRQQWDQGSLLKLIDVIGKTGRNWPIRDGNDQIKLITSSVKSTGGSVAKAAPVASTQKVKDSFTRSRENSTNVTRDPHASLSLFAPRDHSEQSSLPAAVAPKASAKPPPRDYHELFVGNDSDNAPLVPATKQGVRERSTSPHKHSAGVAPKAGGGKNYQPSRLFDNYDEAPVRPASEKTHSADHFYRPNPKKYHHFDFADGSDPQDAAMPPPAGVNAVKSKHASQWNFDDFHTPQKAVPTKVLRGQEVRHWGNEDDEVLESPIRQAKVDKPRKDAETHFEFKDDGTPENDKSAVARPRGPGQSNRLALYQNNLYDEDEKAPSQPESRAVGIANVKDRRKDFDPHFTMTDESPSVKETKVERVLEDKLKTVKLIDTNRATYDESPSANQKENAAPVPLASPVRPGTGKGPLSESTNTMSNRSDIATGINIGGDGMGGRKGTGRSWGFGDDSDGGEEGGQHGADRQFRKGVPGRKQGTAAQTGGGDFWNY